MLPLKNPSDREILIRGRLPRGIAVAIETQQAEFRAEPEISIPSLGNGVNVTSEKSFRSGDSDPRAVAKGYSGCHRNAASRIPCRARDIHPQSGQWSKCYL